MHEERITQYSGGYSIKTDPDKVFEIKDLVNDFLDEKGFVTIDCLKALCLLSIETAYNGGMQKAHFLAKIS